MIVEGVLACCRSSVAESHTTIVFLEAQFDRPVCFAYVYFQAFFTGQLVNDKPGRAVET